MGLYKRYKLVQGVGINDTDYNVYEQGMVDGKNKIIWTCPYYQRWNSMIKRCYSEKYKSKKPTYRGCSVCDEWLIFSQFKSWMETQDWEGKHLDKDLLKVGNKIYSPDTCIFVDGKINTFVNDGGFSHGKYMLGVTWYKNEQKFHAKCSNPITGKRENLGLFTDELEAHLAWKTRKHELACELAGSDLVTDERLAEALRNRYK